MQLKKILICGGFLFFPLILAAENVYLKNGEVLQGRVVSIDEDKLTLQSDLGYGYVDLPLDQILTITYPQNNRIDLSRRYGIGYLNKNGPISSNDRYHYAVNQVSFRTYLTTELFFDYLLGYSSYSYREDENAAAVDYSVFQADFRAAYVIYRRDNLLTYGGGSIGGLYWRDPSINLDEGGLGASIFFGTELFITTLPDFGFSGEIALSYQKTGRIARNDIIITPLPTLAVHFYF